MDIDRKKINSLFKTNNEIINLLIKNANRELKERSIQFLLSGTKAYFPIQHQERYLPVDWIPFLITEDEWEYIEKGIKQRFLAINRFIKDVYSGNQTPVPKVIIESSKYWDEGIVNNGDLLNFAHLYGADLLKVDDEFVLIEDNLGIPSGYSYIEEIRDIGSKFYKGLLDEEYITSKYHFSEQLYSILTDFSSKEDPVICYLTRGPGAADSQEYRHMKSKTNIVLLDPEDMVLEENGYLYYRSLGNKKVKIDVLFVRLSPIFSNTYLQLTEAFKRNKTKILTLPAFYLPCDKGIFPFIPDLIRYYLKEEPIIKQLDTFWLGDTELLNWCISNIGKLVIKARSGLGGKQVLIGSEASKEELSEWESMIMKDPMNFVAQHEVEFAKSHCFNSKNNQFEMNYCDLRCFATASENRIIVMRGGESRVAPYGTKLVNVSSGGSVKDVWVVKNDDA